MQAIGPILVGVDFTEADHKVLNYARLTAKAFNAELHLLHLYAPYPVFVDYAAYNYPGTDEREQELQQEKLRLKTLVDQIQEEGIVAKAFMKEADPARGLLEFAEGHQEGMIIVGSQSKTLIERALLGSTADRLARKSTIPVLIVPTFS